MEQTSGSLGSSFRTIFEVKIKFISVSFFTTATNALAKMTELGTERNGGKTTRTKSGRIHHYNGSNKRSILTTFDE